MVKFSQIIQDVIAGCTANNIDETKVTDFVITYYVNNEKNQVGPFRLEEIEDALYDIIAENLNYSTDVHIYKITTKVCQYGPYPNNVARNYHYSLKAQLNKLR